LVFLDAGFGVGVKDKIIRPTLINARNQGAIDNDLKASVIGVTIAGNREEVG